jgi:hypothetical protein
MPVKAHWHQPELALEHELSFDACPEPERVERVGVPVLLAGPLAELNKQLIGTLSRENALHEQGVTCAIKDRADTSCHACPLYRDDDSALAQLCGIGREQERLCTELAVRMHDAR